MKKIITITMLVLGLVALNSCSKDTYEEKVNSIQVVSGKTELDAVGGELKIILTVENAAVKTEDDWLKASISGNSLALSAETNYSKESRHTYVTVTVENGDFLTIPVTQLGAVCVIDAPESVMASYGAQTLEYDFRSNLPGDLTTSADWIHAAIKDGSLVITLDNNTTGTMRSGSVSYTASSFEKSISVIQAEFDKDIAGKYFLFAGTDIDYLKGESEDRFAILLSRIVKTGSNYSIEFPSLGWSLPVKVNTSTFTVTMPNGTYVGNFQSYYIFAQIADYAAGGYITASKTPTMSAQFVYDEESGFVADIVNNGTWANYNPDSYAFFAYKANSFTSTNRLGYLIWMVEPFLLEYSNNEEAVANYAQPMKIRRK